MARGRKSSTATPATPATAAAPAAANPQPANAVFHLNPFQCKAKQVLDMTNKEDKKTFYSMSAKLSEDYFDCKSEQLLDFITQLKERATQVGWNNDLLMVPKETLPDGSLSQEKVNLLENHGVVDKETLLKYERTYLNMPIRKAQDASAMYQCIMGSLSQQGRNSINTHRSEYVTTLVPTYQPGQPVPPAREYQSGNCLLKIVLEKSHLDTKAAGRCIREELSKLYLTIRKVHQYNISKFNDWTKRQVQELTARGETTSDLVFNILKAYRTIECRPFADFIQRLEERQDEPGANELTVEYLMQSAENKYKQLVREGRWSTKDAQTEKVLVLETQVKKLTKQNQELANKIKKKRPSNGGGNQNSDPNKKSKRGKIDLTKEPTDPKKPVTIGGKKWYWCGKSTGGKCERLRKHKPETCQGPGSVKIDKPSKNLKLSDKVAAQATEISDEGDDEQDIWAIVNPPSSDNE